MTIREFRKINGCAEVDYSIRKNGSFELVDVITEKRIWWIDTDEEEHRNDFVARITPYIDCEIFNIFSLNDVLRIDVILR